MVLKSTVIDLVLFVFVAGITIPTYAQDKVYMTTGKIIVGKVTEISSVQLRILMKAYPDGPLYVFKVADIDSVVYANGTEENLKGVTRKLDKLNNIPQLNTWTFDVLGFTFFSVSQSYERRLKNGKIGFRVPLYIGFFGAGIAGVGLILPSGGASATYNNINGGGFSIATGLNPKFYLFKRRIVRAFIGPEATIGYSKSANYNDYNYYPYYSPPTFYRSGTFALTGKFGLMLNPVDKFNMTIDGGAGIGDIFGSSQAMGLVGLWHVGLAFGTNF